ncbi:MAG: hypothetical protein ABF679_10455 [Lentilactobacillus diolivorans]|uniref:hypothetical protein n=1 Tax=Lentilactobacillus diolivorans TaxID=179838 RepID=UPI0039E8CD01
MLRTIGTILLIAFMLLTGTAAFVELIKEKGKQPTLIFLTNVLMACAGLTAVTYFALDYGDFLVVGMIACLVMIGCAILNGLLRHQFHFWHHVIRIMIVLLALGLCLV